jgi:hypothetical protein
VPADHLRSVTFFWRCKALWFVSWVFLKQLSINGRSPLIGFFMLNESHPARLFLGPLVRFFSREGVLPVRVRKIALNAIAWLYSLFSR